MKLETEILIKKFKHKHRWEINEGLNQIGKVRMEKKFDNLVVRGVRERGVKND